MKDANTKVPIAWDDNPIDVSSEVNFIWGMATLLHAVSYRMPTIGMSFCQ